MKVDMNNLIFLEDILRNLEDEPILDEKRKTSTKLERFLAHLSDFIYVATQIYRKENSLPHVDNYIEHLYFPDLSIKYLKLAKEFFEC